MSIEVTARHMKTSKTLQAYARGKAQVIMDDFPIVEHIHVVLDFEKHRNRQSAEFVAQVKNHSKSDASAVSDNLTASIDLACDKLEKQLRKLMEKLRDHKPAMKAASKRKGSRGSIE